MANICLPADSLFRRLSSTSCMLNWNALLLTTSLRLQAAPAPLVLTSGVRKPFAPRKVQGRRLQSAQTKSGTLDVAEYQGRRWVTRRNLHIDRLASAWLIKQFIDKRPRFYFVADGETVEGSIPFDMFGAEFTHHGEDCTFETMLKQFGLTKIKGLREIAEIVHDIDLKDDKFHRLEAVGLNAIIDGLSQVLKADRKLLQQTGIVFDGLYALLSEQPEKKGSPKTRPGNSFRKALTAKSRRKTKAAEWTRKLNKSK